MTQYQLQRYSKQQEVKKKISFLVDMKVGFDAAGPDENTPYSITLEFIRQ